MRKLWRSASPVKPRQQEGEQVLPVSAPSRGPPQTPHLGVLLNNLLVRAQTTHFLLLCVQACANPGALSTQPKLLWLPC